MMSGHWEFNKADPSSVRVELTQRDQFNNDDVGLAEALVREAIQNSSDAGDGTGPVKVRFSLITLRGGEATTFSAKFEQLRPHLAACEIDDSAIDEEKVRVLAIEDFNTKGLTGSFDALDKDNFENFWRTVGDSEKTGQKGGRWGLGKLVYSSSSRIQAFFGMTVRRGDPGPYLMGQAVLANHVIEDTYYPAHGFWFGGRSQNPLHLQLPVSDPSAIEELRALAGVSRTDQPGLSLIIPYLIEGVEETSIIAGVVNNYYFPILAGKLVVEVGDTLISKETFLEVAAQVQHGAAVRVPFGFVKEISDAISQPPVVEAAVPIGYRELASDHFTDEQIEQMKQLFAAGELVHARIPVLLKPKDKADRTSQIDLFLQALPEEQAPFSLFARGPITLPGERNFAGAVARGAMVANDDDVAEFLGDAENPAHTAWNSNAEKLAARWRNPKPVLSAIRHALRSLYGLIAEQAETQDDEALIDFFSLVDQAQGSSGRRKRATKPKVDVTPREKAISIRARQGGFELVAGPGAASWEYPRTLRVRMAYDMIGANPFKRHSPFDFDLQKKSDVTIQGSDADIDPVKPNILKVVVHGPEFSLQASGFDVKRDLVVDARAI